MQHIHDIIRLFSLAKEEKTKIWYMGLSTWRVFSRESEERAKVICLRSMGGEQDGEKFIPPIASITLSLIKGPLSISDE